MNENNLLIIGIVLVIIVTAGLTYFVAKGQTTIISNPTNTTSPTITVSGEATKTVSPDLLTISFNIDTTGSSASESEMANSEESTNVTNALIAAGLNADEIQTSSYSTYPNYPQDCYNCIPYAQDGGYAGSPTNAPGSAPTVAMPMMLPPNCKNFCNQSGYKTSEVLTVNTNDTTDGGKFIDAALAASNSTSVDYVYFSLTDQSAIALDSELQTEAASAARAKAQAIAQGLGATLGKIESVNPQYNPIYPVYAYQASSGAAAPSPPPTQIYPTDTTMTSSVTVVYDIQQ